MTHPTPAPEPEPGHPPLQILHLSFKETLVLPGARQQAAYRRGEPSNGALASPAADPRRHRPMVDHTVPRGTLMFEKVCRHGRDAGRAGRRAAWRQARRFHEGGTIPAAMAAPTSTPRA